MYLLHVTALIIRKRTLKRSVSIKDDDDDVKIFCRIVS